MLGKFEVFDIHHHIGTLAHILAAGPGAHGDFDEKTEYQTRIAYMDRHGIDMAVALPATGYLQPDGIKDTMKVNDAMAAYHKRDPKRFPVAFGTVEPLHGVRSLDELERMKSIGLVGVVWHHRFQGMAIDGPLMRPLLKKAQELKLVVFIHVIAFSNLEAPWRLEHLAKEFPGINFVALDPFSGGDQSVMILDIAKRTPNIVFDTAVMFWGGDFLKGAIETIGSHRILYSSDLYTQTGQIMVTAPVILNAIRDMQIPDADKANLLGLNAKRLFGLPAK